MFVFPFYSFLHFHRFNRLYYYFFFSKKRNRLHVDRTLKHYDFFFQTHKFQIPFPAFSNAMNQLYMRV